MKIIKIKKGDELAAAHSLRNRTDEDFAAIDETVASIIKKVRKEGDSAVRFYNEKFGGPDIKAAPSLRVTEAEIDAAEAAVEPEMMTALKKAAENIRRFHEKQLQRTWTYEEGHDILLGQLIRPIKNIGITVPGGSASLFSTVLMDIIPAKIAGCCRIVMCTPASSDGRIDKYVLTAARLAGADEIYKVGGAQGIAAMAYGTESIARVDKIVGPGGAYVARAKKQVYGTVDIDMIAGPSEICIIADGSADPRYVAADMLSQAEHDVMSSAILITDDERLASAVATEVESQLKALPRADIARQSIENNGAIFITEDMDSAFVIANDIAPEHLELEISNPKAALDKVECAGAVLLGSFSPEPLGDYVAGPNHTLPTSGSAKYASPLGVYDFLTRTSIIHYSEEDLREVKDVIVAMAEHEGLGAHANSIKVRFGKI